jgi:hypothetical protein
MIPSYFVVVVVAFALAFAEEVLDVELDFVEVFEIEIVVVGVCYLLRVLIYYYLNF